jgi:hypothetical protein
LAKSLQTSKFENVVVAGRNQTDSIKRIDYSIRSNSRVSQGRYDAKVEVAVESACTDWVKPVKIYEINNLAILYYISRVFARFL